MDIFKCHCGRILVDKNICNNCGMNYSNMAKPTYYEPYHNDEPNSTMMHNSDEGYSESEMLELHKIWDAKHGEEFERRIIHQRESSDKDPISLTSNGDEKIKSRDSFTKVNHQWAVEACLEAITYYEKAFSLNKSKELTQKLIDAYKFLGNDEKVEFFYKLLEVILKEEKERNKPVLPKGFEFD